MDLFCLICQIRKLDLNSKLKYFCFLLFFNHIASVIYSNVSFANGRHKANVSKKNLKKT